MTMASAYAEFTVDTEREARASRRAAWDFMAAVENLRCFVCNKRVEYDDKEVFERTRLCVLCTRAVNEE